CARMGPYYGYDWYFDVW
nr:immunoglobulin heavy chain junction region [Mus musculus]NSM08556.1 immunoglobulin heavy chain junction region [Mus musculus]